VSLILKQFDLATQHKAQIELVFAFAANHLPRIKTAHPERRLKFVGAQKRIALVIGEALEDLELK